MTQQDDIAKKNKTIDPDAPKAARRFANGDEILGRYVVQSELGQGGMGVVYRCFDKIGGVEVAVKGLPPEVSHSSDEMEMVRENFQLVHELHHTNIASVLTLEQDEATGDYYLVMTLARGMSLKKWLRQHGGREHRAEQLNVLRQIASALDYAHAAEPRHIIHRDIKPENVMVDEHGNVMVLDFGLAAQVRSSLMRVSQVVTLRSGTPPYMSPEQFLAQPQHAPSDQYSLGVIAYQMFAGELPFDSDNLEILKHAVVFDPVPPIPGEDKAVNAVFAKALAKRPQERFASCAAFVDALSSDGRARIPAAPLKRIAASVILLTLAVVGGWWWLGRDGAGTNGTPTAVSANAVSSVPEVPPVPAVPAVPPASPDKVDLRSLVDAVRVEASVKMAACRRISDEDGFRKIKGECEDALARAVAEYEVKHWAASATAYTNVVERCEAAFSLNEAREQTVSLRQKSETARTAAKEAKAESLASARFTAAEEIYRRGVTECSNRRFAEAKGSFENAHREFSKAAQEAVAERERLAAVERARKEREAEAERERKRKQEAERLANLREEGREFTLNPKNCPGFEMKMKWCPQGSFLMGSPASEEGRYDDEKQHRVTLTKGFWLGETEVTQGQWKQLLGGETVRDLARKALQDDTLYNFGGKQQTLRDIWGLARDADPDERCGDRNDKVPVYNVNWHEAKEFCRRLTDQERSVGRLPSGYEYRLPTEAEWEYACRAGTKTALPNGQDIRILGENNAPALDLISWYGGNSSVGFTGGGWDTSGWKEKQYPGGTASAREVKGKRPNEWGLYDMIGNVWEWCEDRYGDYGSSSYVSDPTGPQTGAGRVSRGGSWYGNARRCRSACRGSYSPGIRDYHLGFRVALAPSLP